ncbi:class I adenylate-forming enzyme family protein [Aminobacter sp. AP02]|uniref:class I adenylate-forming enzyme family protein n=1 Tax=Aminobacter sp. AP02 TaxID=2135737 RepID=UPI000D6A92BD|nr:class I adenylate-forming enzyme family protein [Aminobacter sp. AP02]PWK76993.1 amino acid adenylation domain-containing protein [Aminobacter sp. AP02]
MRVEEFLRESARKYPAKTVLVAGARRLSYSELNDRSDRLASALYDQGIARDDRVLVFMDNCPEAVIAIFAVLKAGAVVVPVNASVKADRLGFLVRNCRARAVLTLARLKAAADEAARGAPDLGLMVVSGNAAMGEAVSFETCLEVAATPPAHGGIDIDLAMLIYTSGSTGEPKGVMMSHRNVEAAASSIVTYLDAGPEDVVLSALPLAFNYGFYQLIVTVRSGGTLILEKSFAYPYAVMEVMRAERATILPLVPTMAAMLIQMKDLGQQPLPDLRTITSAAAPLPLDHISRLRVLFPAARIFSMYGQTECARCTYLPPDELSIRPESVGIAIPGTELFIVDDDGVATEPGVTGELVVRGPHVMQGYWENADATSHALRPGRHSWEKVLFTGDLFRQDKQGFFHFIARKDDIIKSRGEKVPPLQIEAVLHDCPGVAEALVVGIADPVLGQAIHALVVPSDPALTQRDVMRFCARRLEDFMVPKTVEFRSSLPKTDSGKPSRRLALAAMEEK